NDLADDKALAYLVKYDSAHRTWPDPVFVEDGTMVMGERRIPMSREPEPSSLPWSQVGVDVVLESTGVFRTREQLEKHLRAGARKVVLSAPAKGDVDATIVVGVNDENYDRARDEIISVGSCTTNALAPIAKVINDEL